jgi:hypothetical protein
MPSFIFWCVIHWNTYPVKTLEMSADHTARVTPMNVTKLCTQQSLPQWFQTALVVHGMEDSDEICLWLSAPIGKKMNGIYTTHIVANATQ